MKFRKGDRVCALLVANRWAIDFTCFCGKLVKIEETPMNKTAVIMVTHYFDLFNKKKHPPAKFTLDIRLFKLLHWNEETRQEIIALRKASRLLNDMTKKIRAVN